MNQKNTPSSEQAPSKMPHITPKRSSPVNKLLIVLLVILAGAAVYFYSQYAGLKANPSKETEAEAKALVAEVGKLIVLPEGEQPTIATVTDVEKLKTQPFFANAKNGDKVLIYTQAKRAILFDPVNKKLIEVAPINIGDSTKSQVKPAPKLIETPAELPIDADKSETTGN